MALIRLSTLAFLGSLAPVFAQAPDVVTDIPPVHGLVSRVMEGVGAPLNLLKQGASPHDYALRPSDAAALQNADIVFWTGEGLAPWLSKTIEQVAPDALSIPLSTIEGVIHLPFRENAVFDEHDDHDEHDNHDNHDEHDHGAGADDPHMWLDPENAKVWMRAIARTLAEKDPENAVQYEANANAGIAEIDAAIVRISKALEPLHDLRFIVFHDAYHYFEARFGVEAVGAVSMSDASAPSPKRIAQLQDAVERSGVTCAFSEPQYNSQLVDTVLGKSVGARAVIDPLGTHIEAGPQFYIALLDHITQAFMPCQ